MNSPALNFNRMPSPQQGHTLVEMIIATIIGLMLVLSVIGTFAWTLRNNMQDSGTARMQENARYALEEMGKELKMASFMHDMVSASSVGTSDVATIDPTAGCGTGPWILKIASTELISTSHPPDTVSTIETTFPCLAPDLGPPRRNVQTAHHRYFRNALY